MITAAGATAGDADLLRRVGVPAPTSVKTACSPSGMTSVEVAHAMSPSSEHVRLLSEAVEFVAVDWCLPEGSVRQPAKL